MRRWPSDTSRPTANKALSSLVSTGLLEFRSFDDHRNDREHGDDLRHADAGGFVQPQCLRHRQQHRDRRGVEHALGGAAQDEFAHPRMAVKAEHDKVGADLAGPLLFGLLPPRALGSLLTISTRWPMAASAAARLIVVVVLPTPFTPTTSTT